MKIIFMGTPEFACPTLSYLHESKHEILAVYTKPPKPFGRGGAIKPSLIHEKALSMGLNVLTPKNFKNPKDIQEFLNFKADLAVVVAYGVLLPKEILEGTKHGAINIHPSKLPKWRGAAPIQRSIMAGDKTTAVTIMQLDEGMDTGDIILEEEITISENHTAKDLHDITAELGGKLVLKTLDNFEKGIITRIKQSQEGITLANKIMPEDERINWNGEVKLVHRQIMGLSPKPGAYFEYKGEKIKILISEFETAEHNCSFGEVIDDNLTIACLNGYLKPKLLKREGRKEIYKDAFLRGFPIKKGTILN